MCPSFCCKTHSRRRHHSLMPDSCKTFLHASLHIKSPTSTKFPAVQADRGRPLSSCLSIQCCCRFYSATWTDSFCSINSRTSRWERNNYVLLTFARRRHFKMTMSVRRLEARLFPNIGFALQRALAVFTRSEPILTKLDEYIVGKVTIRPGFSVAVPIFNDVPEKITVLPGRPFVPFLAWCPGFVPILTNCETSSKSRATKS